MNTKITDSTVLITGGTGTFGKAFLERCLKEDAHEIRVFSRDEKKQYDLMQQYRGNNNIKFFLGDIRDKRTLDSVMYGVDYVFHAAAMKQVPSCEAFPMEAAKTNINGSDNVISTAIQKRVKKVVVLSTDKAVNPSSVMGLSKAYMEKIALQKAFEQSKTEVCITRFGNLVASRGSVVPLFIEQIRSGKPMTITEPEMTRFMMTVGEAIDLVLKAFSDGKNGDIFVKRSKSCCMGDVAKATCKYLRDYKGENIPWDYPWEYLGKRAGEKMHESLLTEEESEKAFERDGYFVVPQIEQIFSKKIENVYRSDSAERMDENEIAEFIAVALSEKEA